VSAWKQRLISKYASKETDNELLRNRIKLDSSRFNYEFCDEQLDKNQ